MKITALQKIIIICICQSCVLINAYGSKSLALVIGNDNYEEVPTLQKAVNDANSISKKLAELGFDVVTTHNAGYRGMSRSLTELENKIKPGDKIIFYFAGHGFAVDGTNYLLPIDVPKAEPSEGSLVKDSSFAVSSISDRLLQKGAKTVILILDACRDNTFAFGGKRSIGQTRGLIRIDPVEGMFVLFSAGQGQAALDRLSDSDKNPNSIFTRTLLNELDNVSLSMIQIAKNTQMKVKNLAAKVDHVQIPAYYDQVIGDLYLTSPDNESTSLGKIEYLKNGKSKDGIPELDSEQSNEFSATPIASFSNFSGKKNDGFYVTVSLPEPATQFSYRIGEKGDFIDAGLTNEYDQEIRRRKPKTEFSLPASQEKTTIYVTWKDKRGEQSEIYPIPFDLDKELLNMERSLLERPDKKWVSLTTSREGTTTINFSSLITLRCAIKTVYYGLNDGPLDSRYDLGPCNIDDIFSTPPELIDRIVMKVTPYATSISVKLVYTDGNESITRKFIDNGFAGKITSVPNSSDIGDANLPTHDIGKIENTKEVSNCNINIVEYQKKFEDCIKRNALTNGDNNLHALATMNLIISGMRDDNRCIWFDEILSKQEIENSARRKISNKYLTLAETQIKKNNYNSAEGYLKEARYMDPTNDYAKEIGKMIKKGLSENDTKKPVKAKPNATDGQPTPQNKQKITGYVIPGEIYFNAQGLQCRNIEQVADKDGKTIQGKTTACKTEGGWKAIK